MKEEQGATGKIAIIGTGLIGGSLGLALKAGGLQGVRLAGYDADRGRAKAAEKLGAVDRAEDAAAAAVSGAAVVVVAVPILAVRDVLQEIAPHLAEGTLVTDTASTKGEVMRWAAELLPAAVSFVGGHPMAGKEAGGIEQAEAGLFQGAAYCICPAINATPESIRSVTGLAQMAGAEPMYRDAAEHDQYAAAVSQMPLMVSTAMFTLMRSSPSWPDLGAMASSGFRDMTRLASGDPGMALGMWRTNREGVIHWLERMSGELNRYRDLLNDAQDEQLLRLFSEAQVQREAFLSEPPRRRPEGPAVEVDKGKALMDMLIGGKMADNLRRAEKIPEMMRDTGPEPASKDERPRRSLADKIAEDVRRDIEKMEQKRSEKEQRSKDE
jgi:prephenate dehydrogenase